MIFIGLNKSNKAEVIKDYCQKNQIESVVILTPTLFRIEITDVDVSVEYVRWDESGIGSRNEIVQYQFYYRLIQEIDQRTLIIVNECLRSRNRNDLTYNCIRQFLQQTRHQLIFQYFPLIDDKQDFMTLFDFDTRSQWKRQTFSPALLKESEIQINPIVPSFSERMTEASSKVKEGYEKKKSKLFDEIGLKDPHTIPRNLYLYTGKTKLQSVSPTVNYIGRNNRFKLKNLITYRGEVAAKPYSVFELTHNQIEFNDFLTLSGQVEVPVLTTDLKVDQWYLNRYKAWSEEIRETINQIPHTIYSNNNVSTVSQQTQNSLGCGKRTNQLPLRLV